jgi:excisionase family DNA binding protein
MEKKVLTVEEAAAYLRVDSVTVQRELQAGRLPGNKVGRSWRLSKRALAEYVAGGDPRIAMMEAGHIFHRGDLDGGMRVLLRHFMGDSRVASEIRFDLLAHLGKLADAQTKASPELALKAKYGLALKSKYRPGNAAHTEEGWSPSGMTMTPFSFRHLWNRTVDDFVDGLRQRFKKKRLLTGRTR